MRVVQEPPQLRIQTLSSSGTEAADLTAVANGLSFSSTNPGGDERCTFELKRKWFAGAPEIGQGKLVRILDGPDVLFQGRIDENDRRVADSEAIGVTAYGLGIRLRDDESYREIFVDQSPSSWGDIPLKRKLAHTTAGTSLGDLSWRTDQGLIVEFPTYPLGAQTVAETAYNFLPDVDIAKFAYQGANTSLPAGYSIRFTASDVIDTNGDLYTPTFDDTIRSQTLTTPRALLRLWLWSNGNAATPASGALTRVSRIAVYGNHGLPTHSISGHPPGVIALQVVPYIVGLVDGVTPRHVEQHRDTTSMVLPQLVFRDGVTHEQAIVEASRYENPAIDWGTWGPDSVLDTSLDGQFDWRPRDPATQHWYALRSDCDDIALNAELATLYNRVVVSFADAVGVQGVATRTAAVPALDAEGIVRTHRLDGGTLTRAGAEMLGDAFLALSAQRPPARGSVQLSAPVRHYQRGKVWPHRMRADGANLRLPDVLPSEDALSLTAAPDRQTTFPIKRVSVDASGPVPKTTVDVDQTNDTLALLQARLQLAAQLTLGR